MYSRTATPTSGTRHETTGMEYSSGYFRSIAVASLVFQHGLAPVQMLQ